MQISKLPIILTSLVLGSLLLFSAYHSSESSNLQQQPNTLSFTFKSISSILRTTLSRVSTINDTIYAGDSVGSLAIWTYDQKKKKLEFQDISREVAAVLPPPNNVKHLEIENGGALVLTSDGKLTAYAVNVQTKITGSVAINLDQPSSWFTLLRPTLPNPTPNTTSSQSPLVLASINAKKQSLCLYSLASITHPTPLTKIYCNTSSANVLYDHVAFDTVNNLLSVGDENKAIIFQLNVTTDAKVTARYLVEANLPKVQVKGFKSSWTNGTLLAINDLWLSSIIIDTATPSARVISAQRTEKLIKSGQTSQISSFYDSKLKKSLCLINSKQRIQGYTVVNSKLSYVNDSKLIGHAQSFMLKDEGTLFAALGTDLVALKVGDQQEKDYLTFIDQYPIQSDNHFKSVQSMELVNGTFVSVSEGGKFNVKLWNYSSTSYKLSLSDQKTISFFSIMKQGIINFLSTHLIPPTTKQSENVNQTYHVALGGSDPFSLYILPITSANKFGNVFRSKDEHSNNITKIFLSSDKKKVVTASMDTLVKIWTLNANHDQVEDNTTTVITKMGPIHCGAQSKSGEYYAFGHSSNIFNNLVNISIWKQDPKHGLVKLAQNVPGQAHQSNLSGLILTHDQKYLISLSESGQLRLWRLQNWTMVDLMASLSIGVFDATIQATESNKVIIESEKFFAEYYFDQNGFILLGRSVKSFQSKASSSFVSGKTWFSGAEDGSIRVYTYEE